MLSREMASKVDLEWTTAAWQGRFFADGLGFTAFCMILGSTVSTSSWLRISTD